MKSRGGEKDARTYRMTARAEKAAQTGDRILDAALACFSSMEFDEVTLGPIAEAAGVTVQTVIRRFGGKEGLFAALVRREAQRVDADRTPAGGEHASLAEALHALVSHYERDGAAVLNFLKQEGRSEQLAAVVRTGREVHERWVKTYCKSILAGARGAERKRRLGAALVATDLYTWKILRLDRGMSAAEVEKTMSLILEGIGRERGEK